MPVMLFTLLGIIASLFFFLGREKRVSIIEGAVFSLTAYLFSFIASSAVLLAFDIFSVKAATIAAMIIWIALAAYSWMKGNRPSPDYNVKAFVIPIVISVLAVPFVSVAPFEYFAMGQDEGVYQTEAIMYMRDHNSKQYNFAEYEVADTEQFKSEVIEYVTPNNILGTFYYNEINLEMILTGQNTQSIGQNSLVFHGLHTASAMFAWWGTMFGIRNMVGVNALMYILSIFWVSFICRRLKVGNVGSIAACLIFMLSPIVIWVSKSTLTEAGLTLIWLSILYCVLSDRRGEIYLSGALFAIFGLYHVSVYLYLPIFIFIFIALYLYTANKEYIHAMMIAVAAYFVSFMIDLVNAAGYTLMNYVRLFKDHVDRAHMLYWIFAFCLLMEAVGVILLKLKIKKVKFNTTVIKWAVRAFMVLLIIFSAYRIIKDMPPFKYSSYLTIVAMAVLTGIVLPAIVFISMFIKTDKWTDNKEHLTLLVLSMYCIVFYSIFLMQQIPEYYYFARYFAMYIPLITIVGAIVFDRMKPSLGIIATVLSAAILLPHSLYLMTHIDDTKVQWDSLDEIEETLQFSPPDAIFMRRELYMLFYYEFKSFDIPVYPITDNFERNVEYLETQYDTIYIMDYTFDERFEENCPIVRRFLNLDEQDLGQYKTPVFHLPNGNSYNMQTVTIYQWEPQE